MPPPVSVPLRIKLCRLALVSSIAAFSLAGPPAVADDDHGGAAAATGCRLSSASGQLKHIVHLQFDNVHLRRDNPNVPSDLEQMPNLLNFLQDKGALLTHHHTPLISHTADDIVTTLTGVYGEKHGQPVSNSYGYFRTDGSVGFSSSFVYWTNIAPDGQPQMVDPRGKIHPAPWVPFTRAGCDVGAFSTANIEFENTTSDITNVFGVGSAEANEVANEKASTNPAVQAKPTADFEGIAVHCAKNSAVCGQAGKPDLVPDEPGGYVGFNGLFGNKYVAPRINHGVLGVNDLDGQVIADSFGNPGFPGFSPSASQSLGYVATLLEAGVPVVYAYISDAHDNHFTGSGSYGPGEAGYVQQLAAFNAAFGKFFDRLKGDGITSDNTLFIVTADENDHFAGQAGSPAGCDGIHTPCTYIRLPAGCDGSFAHPCSTTNLGEVGADLRALLLTEFPGYVPPSFSVHSDDAPTVYINGQPGPAVAVTRALEHKMAGLLGADPIKGGDVPIMKAMAGQAEMALLHMVTHDPARTPTFTLFGDPDFFFTAGSNAPCTSLAVAPCSSEQPAFNWNHGDFQEEITRTWLGIVGPGVRPAGRTGAFFSDHTDVRPTLLALAGLQDDYVHDGRVLFEVLQEDALPQELRAHQETLTRLATLYKAINAPRGTLGRMSLPISTSGLVGDDSQFVATEAKLTAITAKRNAIAGAMIALLEGAAFGNKAIDEGEAQMLIAQAQQLLESLRPSDD